MLGTINENCKNVIAMSSSNEYVPYLSVYLISIIKNSNPQNFYDIVILESDITTENKKRIQALTNTKNISIRFFNVNELFENIDLYISYAYFTKQCYYRLALGKIFADYEKVIYTDIDLICTQDIYELFNVDMNNYPLAACEEILWTNETRKGISQLGLNVENYIHNIVGCTDKYYNTGVIVVNIPEFNKVADFNTLIEIALNNKFINQEQCVLNRVFNEKIFTLEASYNFEIYSRIFNGKEKTFTEYMEKIDEAKIYHYLTVHKAWFNPELPKGYLWWQYARISTYYEEILKRMCTNTINTSNGIINRKISAIYETIQNVVSWRKNILQYWKYRFLRNFVFGKTRERYSKKKHLFKEKIRNARQYLK